MTTTYRLHVDELDPAFVERVKAAFADKVIEIQVTETDETDALLSDPARRERLLRAADDVAAGEKSGRPGTSAVPVRNVAFHADAFGQFTAWSTEDRKAF